MSTWVNCRIIMCVATSLVELSTNILELSPCPEKAPMSQCHDVYFLCLLKVVKVKVKAVEVAFNKKRPYILRAFSGHCETSRRFVDSSSGRVGCDCVEMSIWHDNTINQGAVQTL